jgi:hypothetical protein
MLPGVPGTYLENDLAMHLAFAVIRLSELTFGAP